MRLFAPDSAFQTRSGNDLAGSDESLTALPRESITPRPSRDLIPVNKTAAQNRGDARFS
jgi:hypothetical protein